MEKDINNLPDLICEEYSLKYHNPSSLSPLTLAFIGDTIFDLIVRTRVIECGNAPVRKLHHTASSLVNAGKRDYSSVYRRRNEYIQTGP